MKPQEQGWSGTEDLFRQRLENLLDLRHPLTKQIFCSAPTLLLWFHLDPRFCKLLNPLTSFPCKIRSPLFHLVPHQHRAKLLLQGRLVNIK